MPSLIVNIRTFAFSVDTDTIIIALFIVVGYLTWKRSLIEGMGVTPNIAVEVSADQLFAGEDGMCGRKKRWKR